MTLIAPAVLSTIKPIFDTAANLLLADGTSNLLRADGTSLLLLTQPPSHSIAGAQDISALGTLEATDLLYGFKPGAPDDDYSAALSGLKEFIGTGDIVGTAVADGTGTLVSFIDGTAGVVFDTTYKKYTLMGYGIYDNSATGNLEVGMQIRRVGQGSFDATVGHYKYVLDGFQIPPASTASRDSLNSASRINIMYDLGTNSTQTGSFLIEIYGVESGIYKLFNIHCANWTSENGASNPNFRYNKGTGVRLTTEAIDGIQVFVGAGTFVGTFVLIGHRE